MLDRGKGRLVFLNRQIGKSVNRGKRGTKLYNYDIHTFWYVDYISIQRWKKKKKQQTSIPVRMINYMVFQEGRDQHLQITI